MSMNSMKNYRLAVDENGSPFVLNSKGSIRQRNEKCVMVTISFLQRR